MPILRPRPIPGRGLQRRLLFQIRCWAAYEDWPDVITGQLDFLKYPYHQGIVNHELPLSIGGGIDMCAMKNILILE